MAISPAALRQLVSLSLKPAQMAGVLTIIAEIQEESDRKDQERALKLSKDRERKKRGHSMEIPMELGAGNSAEVPVEIPANGSPDKEGSLFPDKETSPTPPKENNPSSLQEINPSSLASLANRARESADLRTEFDRQFWPVFPNKVGKPAAFKAFCKARKSYDLSAILFGVDRYVVEKPADRSWLNPATFLNQERFNDEPAPPVSNGKISGKDTMLEILFGEQSRGSTLDLKSETKLLGK